MTDRPPGGAATAPGRHAIGIDVGGTKIAGGIVDLADGSVTARHQVPTACERGGAPVLADVRQMTGTLMAEARQRGWTVTGLGIGVAELVDPAGGIFSDHRIKWRGLDLAGELGPIAGGCPVRVSSDVRAAALAEARFGLGRGVADFYFLTIGTGVSGVLVQNGRPYEGSRGAALVIANGTTLLQCQHCGALTETIVEDIASGPGIAAAWGSDRAETVLQAAERGDVRALAIIDHATRELGRIVALLVNSLDPAVLILGGGLGSAPGAYVRALTAAIRAGLWTGALNDLPILQSQLGDDAGLIGAAVAADPEAAPGVGAPGPPATAARPGSGGPPSPAGGM
jgi:glucokinase